MFLQQQYYSAVTHQFCVTYKQTASAFNMQSFHFHNVYELYFFLSGERLLFYRDRLYHISEGDIVFIPKNELHRFTDVDTPGYSMFLVDFQDSFLESLKTMSFNFTECFEKDITVISIPSNGQPDIKQKFQEILSEYEGSMPHRDVQLRLKLASLLLSLSALQDICGEKNEACYKKQFVVSKVIRYINENYQKKLTLEEIAKHVKYSRNYLCGYFKKYAGFTIVEYTNSIRVQKAQEYLYETELSITEIAGLCGFDSLTHFGRVFRSIVGIPPLQFRQNKK